MKDAWRPYVLSAFRIVIAFLFIAHGTQKLFGVPSDKPMQTMKWMSQFGVAGMLETFGGAFVFLGLFTRPVAFVLCGEMAVAYFQAHAGGGFWPILNHGELAVLYCFSYLYLAVAGGGPLSIDAMRRSGRAA
jgi:putative oxidoreductase